MRRGIYLNNHVDEEALSLTSVAVVDQTLPRTSAGNGVVVHNPNTFDCATINRLHKDNELLLTALAPINSADQYTYNTLPSAVFPERMGKQNGKSYGSRNPTMEAVCQGLGIWTIDDLNLTGSYHRDSRLDVGHTTTFFVFGTQFLRGGRN